VLGGVIHSRGVAMNSNYWRLGIVFALLLAAGMDRISAVPDPVRKPKNKAPEIRAEPDPGTLGNYRNQIGKSFYFQVTGSVAFTVWGTGIYTDDSHLGTAAVHAGVLRAGQKGVVKVTMLAGQANYAGTTRNGVTSHPYQAWNASYRVEAVDPRLRVKIAGRDGKVLADPGTLSNYQGKTGTVLLIRVTGTTTGSVWGTGVYTDDSTLAAAAVHAGVLGNGKTGVVRVTILVGQNAYQGTTSNGVTSNNYGNWGGSFKVEAVKNK